MIIHYEPPKSLDEFEKVTFADVDEKIIRFMVKMLDRAEEEQRLVNWIDFKKYCMSPDALLEVLVPEATIDRCLEEARKWTKYKLAFQSSIPKQEIEPKYTQDGFQIV